MLNTSESFDAATQAGYGGGEESRLKRTARKWLMFVDAVDSHYYSFVELHIEQGPELEHEKLDIGVVTAIAAPAARRLR